MKIIHIPGTGCWIRLSRVSHIISYDNPGCVTFSVHMKGGGLPVACQYETQQARDEALQALLKELNA